MWVGWHAIARDMRDRYGRFVVLSNEGAREMELLLKHVLFDWQETCLEALVEWAEQRGFLRCAEDGLHGESAKEGVERSLITAGRSMGFHAIAGHGRIVAGLRCGRKPHPAETSAGSVCGFDAGDLGVIDEALSRTSLPLKPAAARPSLFT